MTRDPLIGQVLHDTHQIVRVLGEGGMGTVYEAVHRSLSKKKRFAIKVLNTHLVRDAANYARFQREALITSEIGHPNIVEVLDFYETDDGRPCIVMEYLEGEDLERRLRQQGGKLLLEDVLAVVEQVASALQAVHDVGVVHRDLKPANILLLGKSEEPLRVKVLDFGISKAIGSTTHLTQERMIVGTPHYMSPEQASGTSENLDHLTDIFALGIIVFQTLSGRLPFTGSTPLVVLRQIIDMPHPSLASVAPELPEQVSSVLDRALAKRREERYPRADMFAAALKSALSCGHGQMRRTAVLERESGGPGNELNTATGRGQQSAMPPPIPRSEPGAAILEQAVRTEGPAVGAGTPVAIVPSIPVPEMAPQFLERKAGTEQCAQIEAELSADIPRATTTLTGSSAEWGKAVVHSSGHPRRNSAVAALAGVVMVLVLGAIILMLQRSTMSPEERENSGAPGRAPAKVKSISLTPGPGHRDATPTVPGKPAAEDIATASSPLPPKGDPPKGVALPAQAQVTVRLHLSPEGARARIDGKPVTGDSLLMPRSRVKHILRVTAPGHISEQRVFSTRETTEVTVNMRRRSKGRARVSRRPAREPLSPAVKKQVPAPEKPRKPRAKVYGESTMPLDE